MLPLSQLSEKMHKRCQAIGNVIFDMENAQHTEEDKKVAEELRIEVDGHEEQIKLSLEAIGTIEQQHKSAKDDFERKKRIEQEKKSTMQHSRRG